MVSARWVITAALMLGVVAAAIGYARYFRGRPTRPNYPLLTSGRPETRGLPRLRCDSDHVVDDQTSAEDRQAEASLYEQLIRRASGGKLPELVVVEEMSIPVPLVGDFEGPPRELATWIAGNRRHECSFQTTDRFPVGVFLLPSRAPFMGNQGSPRMDWSKFHDRFPGAPGWFAFSRAKFATDRRDAVVYYDRFCAAACGEGKFVWFHRANAGATWQIAGEKLSWAI